MTCPNCDRLREALERIADGACRGSPYSYEGHCSGTCENIAYVALDALAATATEPPTSPREPSLPCPKCALQLLVNGHCVICDSESRDPEGT